MTAPYARPDKWKRSAGPDTRGAIAARAALRVLGLAIVTSIDAGDCDLAALATKAERVGRAAMRELGVKSQAALLRAKIGAMRRDRREVTRLAR